ncbi:hypothetical protein [Prosthecobacter sp.]
MAASLLRAEEPRLELKDIENHTHAPLEPGDKQAIVLLFIEPYAYSALRAINLIVPDYDHHMAIYLVWSDRRADRRAKPESDRMLAESLKMKTPVLLDPELALARKVQARVTPEAIVIGRDGKTLYKGRIDNSLRMRENGMVTTSVEPPIQDLRAALNAILAGRPVPEPQYEAVGKKIPGMVPPPPADFRMNAILATGPVLMIAGLLKPFINGYKEGNQASSVCWGWLLLFVGSLFVYWFSPELVSKYYGPEAAEPLYSDSSGPGGVLITGWLPG